MPDGILERIDEKLDILTDRVLANLTTIQSKIDKLLAREFAIDANYLPSPAPTPPPAPTPIDPLAWPYKLVGGWRLKQEFLRGALAMRFADDKPAEVWTGAHEHDPSVVRWVLPAPGVGEDIAKWPLAHPAEKIPGWWEQGAYLNSLAWHEGKLWAAPRVFYDMKPPTVMFLFSLEGKAKPINLPRQMYSGFVKGEKLHLGCGGRESGQGSACGPSLATLDGDILIRAFPFDAVWEFRTARESNYECLPTQEKWLSHTPRMVNGKLEGRWQADWVYGGGLYLSQGVTYWPWMGIGKIGYVYQNETLSEGAKAKAYRYVYDPVTYRLLGWREWPYGRITGHELGPDGKVYLLQADAWTSGLYQKDSVILVFAPV